MVYNSMSEDQKQDFFQRGYNAHLPGYTGHCPTLKFRVGKRFGANTEEILKELLEKKILKKGPYRPHSGKDILVPIDRDNEVRRDWKNEAHFCKAPPYILGYTGYIPGFNHSYGLSFMRAVEEGAKEWHDIQSRLRARRDAMRAQAERTDPRNLLSRAKNDNVEIELNHCYHRRQKVFDTQLTPDKPPIVGYTGHIPGVKREISLSKRYAQAARKGLEFVQKQREEKLSRLKDATALQRVLDTAHDCDANQTRAYK